MTEIVQVRAADIPALSSILEPLLSPAVARNSGRMTTADALDMAISERAKLWLATDGDEVLGGVLGMPVQYYRRKSLSVLFVAGHSRERWETPMFEAVERGARHIGCDLLEGVGRRGFGRILSGCRVIGYLFEKELTDGRP